MAELNEIDARLLWLLRKAGEEWGPAGVAQAAAMLAGDLRNVTEDLGLTGWHDIGHTEGGVTLQVANCRNCGNRSAEHCHRHLRAHCPVSCYGEGPGLAHPVSQPGAPAIAWELSHTWSESVPLLSDPPECTHGGDCKVPGHPNQLHGPPSSRSPE